MQSDHFRIALSLITNKVADLLISPKTTLPALLSYSGAPMYLSALLVTIRESGALLPQILLAKMLDNVCNRHIAWRCGALLQLICTLLMLLAAFSLEGLAAGICIVAMLTLWSVSRALCSLTMKDIQGKHVKKGQRGGLIGIAGSVSSAISVVVALMSIFVHQNQSDMDTSKLLFIAGVSVSAQIVSLIALWPLKTIIKTGDSNQTSLFNNTLGSTLGIKRFIIMRGLLSHSALVAPLFTLAYKGNMLSFVGFLILAQACAGLLSSAIWGKFADKSALLTMRVAASIALLSCMFLVFLVFFDSYLLNEKYVVVSLFFILSVGHGGVRIGRKVYSVDIADGQNRTEFVAVSNSAVGVFILVAGVIYTALSAFSILFTMGVMTMGLLSGILMSYVVRNEK